MIDLESDLILGDIRKGGISEVPFDVEYQHALENLLALPARRSLRIGDVLNDYRLVEFLGEGGMGTVYRAFHVRLEREVALKVIRLTKSSQAQMADRFRREMKAGGMLRHQNLVLATDAGVANGVQYLAMEFVPGFNFAKLVERDGPVAPPRGCDLVRQAAFGLQHAHENGLVHRDVKPSNLLLGSDGIVRVLDLGLALFPNERPPSPSEGDSTTTGDDSLTSPGQQLGTRNYIAPEQLVDSHRVDLRADIYGLGCTLAYLLTGRPPKAGKGFHPSIPAEVWKKFLSEYPADRFPSMLAVADALAPYCSAGSRRRSWRIPAAVAAMLGVIVVALAFNRPLPIRDVAAVTSKPSDSPSLERAPAPRVVPPGGSLPMKTEEAVALQKLWADHLGQPVVEKNSLEMELALIPPGEFGLYATYHVTLTKPFRMGTLEVTRGQFAQFIAANPTFKTETEANPRTVPASFATFRLRTEYPQPIRQPVCWRAPVWGEYSDDQPIVYLTLNDAAAFLKWLSTKEHRTYRLPTHAEWAWACRAGTATRFHWGHDVQAAGEYAWTRMANVDRPQPVGKLKPNAWGLYDMLGNVAEMVQDYNQLPLPAGRATDPVNAVPGTERIACGGGYMSLIAYSLDTLPAAAQKTAMVDSMLGFRVVLEP